MRQENEDQDDQQRSDDEYGLPRSRPLQAEKAIASTLVNMVSIFADFLTVSIHTILYEREIYSHDLFISTRAYNHPVRQARHPVLCKWIQDAVEACSVQLTEGRVSKISLVAMSAHTFEPLERYVWDVSSFPVVPTGEHHTPFQSHTDLTALSGATLSDMEEQLRAAIGKIRTVSAGLAKLPDGCTFTISIELREEAPAPVGYTSSWIPSENQKTGKRSSSVSPSGSKTTPIRTVEAGALFMELWVEESKFKERAPFHASQIRMISPPPWERSDPHKLLD